MKLFRQYGGLRREMYVLFFGRVVTNMGALIWPMLTLILSNKLNMSASNIAVLLFIMSAVQLPCTLLGGKLADKFNKRDLIIVCDLITVTCYLICACIPISSAFIVFFFIAGLFAAMEYPCYDALVADLSTSEDREKAYSLNYLGGNIGLVLAPTLGGLLFENHLNIAFLISGLATLLSTILIFSFIKQVKHIAQQTVKNDGYEAMREGHSLFSIFKERRILILFMLCSAVGSLVYSQFTYLLPLNLESLYEAKGATYFGLLTSVNAIVVIIGTPTVTSFFSKIRDVTKMLFGEIFITCGLSMYIFVQGNIPMYFAAIIVFTVGEIFMTIGLYPYMTKRIPATHRGRIASVHTIFTTLFQACAQTGVGFMFDHLAVRLVWSAVGFIGTVCIVMIAVLRGRDKKAFPLLYAESKAAST